MSIFLGACGPRVGAPKRKWAPPARKEKEDEYVFLTPPPRLPLAPHTLESFESEAHEHTNITLSLENGHDGARPATFNVWGVHYEVGLDGMSTVRATEKLEGAEALERPPRTVVINSAHVATIEPDGATYDTVTLFWDDEKENKRDSYIVRRDTGQIVLHATNVGFERLRNN